MSVVLAYHGCDASTAQALLGGFQFQPSDKPWDWLGSGAYFWEGDILRAYQWAQSRHTSNACVVGAAIEFGSCLDLTTQAGIRAVSDAHRSYINMQTKAGAPLLTNRPGRGGDPADLALRLLDKAVIDHLHDGYRKWRRRR